MFLRDLTAENTATYLMGSWGGAVGERSPPTNVTRVRFPDPASYLGWVCCWFSTLLRGFFSLFSGFPPSSKINISKFQFDREFEGHGFVNRRLLCATFVKQSQFILFSTAQHCSAKLVPRLFRALQKKIVRSFIPLLTLFLFNKIVRSLWIRSLDTDVLARALAGDIVLCSWARHLTLTVPLSTQVYKWVPATLMLGVTLPWTGIQSRGE